MANGFTRQEVQKAAEEARGRVKKPVRWISNEYLVIGANDKGVTLSDNTMMPWVQAAKVAGKLSVETGRKEGLLDKMRRIYLQVSDARPHVAAVGKAVAGV